MTATQCPHYAATRMLRGTKNGPVKAYLGLIRGRKPTDGLFGASLDKQDIVACCPSQVMTVNKDMRPETLAAAIAATWARLEREMATCKN